MAEVTPAEELRAAAKLMRVDAERATNAPWRALETTYGGTLIGAVVGAAGDANDPGTWIVATGVRDPGQNAPTPDAIFIASWHPGVAKAVADWLDRFSVEVYCYGQAEFDHALAIARAYLGTGATDG